MWNKYVTEEKLFFLSLSSSTGAIFTDDYTRQTSIEGFPMNEKKLNLFFCCLLHINGDDDERIDQILEHVRLFVELTGIKSRRLWTIV